MIGDPWARAAPLEIRRMHAAAASPSTPRRRRRRLALSNVPPDTICAGGAGECTAPLPARSASAGFDRDTKRAAISSSPCGRPNPATMLGRVTQPACTPGRCGAGTWSVRLPPESVNSPASLKRRKPVRAGLPSYAAAATRGTRSEIGCRVPLLRSRFRRKGRQCIRRRRAPHCRPKRNRYGCPPPYYARNVCRSVPE